MEAKHIAKTLEIADRVECMDRKPAYRTLNDHKKNYNINPKCRLINPAKSELGKIAKIINKISIKPSEKSYTEHLMLKAVQHANSYTSITQEELDIILHARKTLLFSRNKAWKKPINESLFDIAMESYDGASICEPVRLYILSILGKIYGIQNVGLYLDDGLACLQKINGQASDKIQKDIIFPGELTERYRLSGRTSA